MGRTTKAAEVLAMLGALLAVLLFPLLTLYATLFPEEGRVRVLGRVMSGGFVNASPFVWLAFALFLILALELVARVLRENLAIRAPSVAALAARTPTTAIARPYQAGALAKAALFALLFLALDLLVWAALLSLVASNPFRPRPAFFLLLVVYGLYLVFRRPIRVALAHLFAPLARWLRQALPTATHDECGLTLDLKRSHPRREDGKSLVRLEFSELGELAVLTYREAQVLRRYHLGLNPDYIKGHLDGLMRYHRGEVERPAVYLPELSTMGKVLFLSGPGLLYLLNVSEEGLDDVVAAYYCAGGGLPPTA